MEKSGKQKLRLGIFVILGTVLLVMAVYFIGNRQNLFGDTFEISAVFRNVNGLQKGNNVRFAGINVGTVRQIEMHNDTTIQVYMLMEEEMLSHIRKDAIATIGSDGLVGSMIINISPGPGQGALIEKGDVLTSYSRIASEDMLGTLNVTNENAALLTADLLVVTQSLIKGKGVIGQLLNDTIMAHDMYKAIANLRGVSEEINLTMSHVNEILAKVNFQQSAAGVLLGDSISGQRLRNLISTLESSGMEIRHTTEELNSMVRQISEGQGALHYLSKDKDFVLKLDSTMTNIQEGTQKFNESMDALQQSFLLRKYFRDKD